MRFLSRRDLQANALIAEARRMTWKRRAVNRAMRAPIWHDHLCLFCEKGFRCAPAPCHDSPEGICGECRRME